MMRQVVAWSGRSACVSIKLRAHYEGSRGQASAAGPRRSGPFS